MSYKIPYKRNKNSILLCQSHCVLKTMHLKAACCWAHSLFLLIPALVSSLQIIPCPLKQASACAAGHGCLYVRVSQYLQPHHSPGSESGGYPADPLGLHRQRTHIYTSTLRHTQSSELPGSSTAGSNEGPIAGIQRTPHNCLIEKPKLLMGTTLIFPCLKEAFFPPLSLISKCLVFQNAHCVCVSDGLLWIKAFSADNKWFKCASHYSGWRWELTGSFIFHSCSMVDSW